MYLNCDNELNKKDTKICIPSPLCINHVLQGAQNDYGLLSYPCKTEEADLFLVLIFILNVNPNLKFINNHFYL